MNVVLIGYRGTGKTAVGRLLADRLGLEYFGMDGEIVRRAGMPVPEIVEQRGWPGFRDLESEVAQDVAGRDGLVVDTGGGVIERPGNVAALKERSLIFWLRASVDVIVARISDDTQRPALVEGRTFTEEPVGGNLLGIFKDEVSDAIIEDINAKFAPRKCGNTSCCDAKRGSVGH